MKILQINKYHFIKGGADSVFFNTSTLLRNHGHEVIEFCTQNPLNLFSASQDYFAYAPEIREQSGWGKIKSVPRFFWNSDAASRLDRLLGEHKPDVAHIHNMFNGLSLSILPVLKKHHVPVVVTVHDTRFICPSSYFNLRGKHCDVCLKQGGLNCGLHKCYQNDFLNSWMCALEMFHKEFLFNYDRFIDKYIFVSNRYRLLHQSRHSYFSDKGCVLYNFLPDMKQIVPNNKKGTYLFYYGRITEEKGIRTLIEAMKTLPGLTLKVAGNGPLLDALKAKRLDNVEFLGFKSGSDLFKEVRNASFVIVPSEWEENNPLTVIEAYAYGKPVIGSRMGGIPEIVNVDTGFLFDAFDLDGLRSVIRKAASMTNDAYNQMSDNARRFAEANFDAGKHYMNLIDIYNQVIDRK